MRLVEAAAGGREGSQISLCTGRVGRIGGQGSGGSRLGSPVKGKVCDPNSHSNWRMPEENPNFREEFEKAPPTLQGRERNFIYMPEETGLECSFRHSWPGSCDPPQNLSCSVSPSLATPS